MSQISAFNPVHDATRSTANRFQDMKSEDFIRIMFTELSNQDPFKPNDSAALLQQLNSIRGIESDLKLVERLDALVTQNQMSAAGSLVGRFVTGLTDGALRVGGLVVAAGRYGDDVYLGLDNGWEIRFDQLETVHNDDPQ